MAPSKTASQAKPAAASSQQSPVLTLWNAYNETTSTRLKTIDAFLVFLMLSGIIQFLYCILVTNFPFNAFLAGYVLVVHIGTLVSSVSHSFSSCVGQFVLAASLRAQVNPANKNEFKEVSPERCVPPLHTPTRVVVTVPHLQGVRGLRSWLDRTTLLRVQLPRMIERAAQCSLLFTTDWRGRTCTQGAYTLTINIPQNCEKRARQVVWHYMTSEMKDWDRRW